MWYVRQERKILKVSASWVYKHSCGMYDKTEDLTSKRLMSRQSASVIGQQRRIWQALKRLLNDRRQVRCYLRSVWQQRTLHETRKKAHNFRPLLAVTICQKETHVLRKFLDPDAEWRIAPNNGAVEPSDFIAETSVKTAKREKGRQLSTIPLNSIN